MVILREVSLFVSFFWVGVISIKTPEKTPFLKNMCKFRYVATLWAVEEVLIVCAWCFIASQFMSNNVSTSGGLHDGLSSSQLRHIPSSCKTGNIISG